MAPPLEPATRAQVPGPKAFGITNDEICRHLNVSSQGINAIFDRAVQQAYKPHENPRILQKFLVDPPRPGRPWKVLKEKNQESLSLIRIDPFGKEKPCKFTPQAAGVSLSFVWRALRAGRSRTSRLTRKLGIT